jgi:hypothetical protein
MVFYLLAICALGLGPTKPNDLVLQPQVHVALYILGDDLLVRSGRNVLPFACNILGDPETHGLNL